MMNQSPVPALTVIDELINRALVENGVVLLGISGLEGSGKSTLASSFAERVTSKGLGVQNLDVDGFLRLNADRREGAYDGQTYYDDAFDLAYLFGEVLEGISGSGPIRRTIRQYLEASDEHVDRTFELLPPAIVIVEGVMIFRREYRDRFDCRIWIDVDFEVSLERALKRVRDLAHYGGRHAVIERFENRVVPGERLHLRRDRPVEHAHVVLPGVVS